VTEQNSIAQLRRRAISERIDSMDVDVLLCFALQKDRNYLYTWPETTLSEIQRKHFDHLIERRKNGEPVAYLTGSREFWSLSIKTNAYTLIPRPDTEILVETVLQHCDASPKVCVDLGTGTGAIALALKHERPQWQVSGIDRIPEAVELAIENANHLQLSVDFQQGNWCAGLDPSTVEIIVSNPPYIDALDSHLKEGDVRFEPISALVAENHGLSDIQQIIIQAKQCLRSNGLVFLEHGWQQGAQVRDLLTGAGFTDVATVKDYGGNERVSFGVLA